MEKLIACWLAYGKATVESPTKLPSPSPIILWKNHKEKGRTVRSNIFAEKEDGMYRTTEEPGLLK